VVVVRRGAASPPHHRASDRRRSAFSGDFPALFFFLIASFSVLVLVRAVVVAVRRDAARLGFFFLVRFQIGASLFRSVTEVVWLTGVVVVDAPLKLGFVSPDLYFAVCGGQFRQI
jgi:hypothetical protein